MTAPTLPLGHGDKSCNNVACCNLNLICLLRGFMLILFSAFAAMGATLSVVIVVAWYRGLLPILEQYLETMGDIVSGKEIIVHKITLEELLEYYEDEDEDEEE